LLEPIDGESSAAHIVPTAPLDRMLSRFCHSPPVQENEAPVFDQVFKNVDDVLWKEAGCTTELDYTEQTSWLLFLKYLDGLEQDRAAEAALRGAPYSFILEETYRWESWAEPRGADGQIDHHRALAGDDLLDFAKIEFFPYLRGFKEALSCACNHVEEEDAFLTHDQRDRWRRLL
jgi:hypothetical protein